MFPTFLQFLKNETLNFETQKLQGGNTFNKTHCAAITNVKNEDDILKWKQCSMLKMSGLHEYFCEHHKALICQDPQKVHVIPNLIKDIKHFIYFPPFPPIGKTKEANEEDNFNNDDEFDMEEIQVSQIKKETAFPLLSTYYEYTFNLVKSYDVYKSKNELPESESESEEEEEEYGSAETFKRSNTPLQKSKSQTEEEDKVDRDFEQGVSESLGEEFFEVPDEDLNDDIEVEQEKDDVQVVEEEAYEEEDKEQRKSTRNKSYKQDKYTFIKENLAKDYNNALRLADEYDVHIPKGRKGYEKKRAILQLVANVKYWKGELKAGNKSPEFGGKKFNDAIFNAFE